MSHFIIIGGGVTGLYSALKIREKYPDVDTKITVLEKMSKVGGVIQTDLWNNFKIEHGPTHIRTSMQPQLMQLLKELEIETIECKPHLVEYEPLAFQDFTEREQLVVANSKYTPACALFQYGIMQVLSTDFSLLIQMAPAQRREHLLNDARYNDAFLHKLGIWNVLSTVLSHAAICYVQQQGIFYHIISLNINAANVINMFLDILFNEDERHLQIKGGMNKLIARLEKKLQDSDVQIKCNTTITNIVDTLTLNNTIAVYTQKEEVFSGSHVIFAIPPKAYEKIKGLPDGVCTALRSSIVRCPVCKVYVVFDNPPYDESSIPKHNTNLKSINGREICYKYDEALKLGMIQMVCDYPTINYWCASQDNLHLTIPNDVIKYRCVEEGIRNMLLALFPKSDCKVHHFTIINWSGICHESGLYFWKPMCKSNVVIDTINRIHDRIRFCGDALSEHQGFIEGALDSVNKVISTL